MNAYVTSLLRTYVPLLWGVALSWLVGVGVLDAAGALDYAPFGPAVLVPITTAIYYALVRALERAPWWPGWLSALLLGSSTPPSYPAPTTPADPVVRLHAEDVAVLVDLAAELRRLTPSDAVTTAAMRAVGTTGARP